MLSLCKRRIQGIEDEPSRWFVKKGDVENGPLEFSHLQHLIDFGLLAPNDLVRTREDARWSPIGQLAVARRLKWPARTPPRRRGTASGGPAGSDAESPMEPEEQPGPVSEKLSSVVHGGALLVERCRVLLRGLALALISLGGYGAVFSLRALLFPVDNPFLGLAFVFIFLGLAAFWVTYDGEESY